MGHEIEQTPSAEFGTVWSTVRKKKTERKMDAWTYIYEKRRWWPQLNYCNVRSSHETVTHREHREAIVNSVTLVLITSATLQIFSCVHKRVHDQLKLNSQLQKHSGQSTHRNAIWYSKSSLCSLCCCWRKESYYMPLEASVTTRTSGPSRPAEPHQWSERTRVPLFF